MDTNNSTPHIGPHGVGCKCPPQNMLSKVGMFARVRHDLEKDRLHPVYELVYFDGDAVGADAVESDIPDEHIATTVHITLNTQSPAAVAAMQLMKDDLGEHFGATIDAHTKKMMAEDVLTDMLSTLFGGAFADFMKTTRPSSNSTEDSPARDEF